MKAAEIQSQQSAQVKYHYVVESELTETEKSALIREIPKYVEDASETYYLVYRPTTQGDTSGVLPKTGHSVFGNQLYSDGSCITSACSC